MAPVSDKRSSPPPHLKEGGHSYHSHGHGHSHTHTKENATGHRHSKKGLEILDFHESWLEEMELYKDQMYVQKQHQNQLLSSHNHAHTPEGCQIEKLKVNPNNNGIVNMNSPTSKILTNNLEQPQTANNKVNERRRSPEQTNNNSKSRVVVRNVNINNTANSAVVSAANAANALISSSENKINGTVQLLLKRPRDESSVNKTVANTLKRHSQQSSQSITNQTHCPNSPKSGITVNTILNHNSNSTALPSNAGAISLSSKPTAKIIVNTFHASSLLNSHHQDEKTKILTQNGLTKSAATAYETSMYAANYLQHDNRMANRGDHDRTKELHHHFRRSTDEDPCAAIDDVTEFSDDESEEDYIGHPFYLEEDGTETRQSRNIRFQEKASSTSSDDSLCDRSEYYRPKSILSPSIFPNVPPYLNFSSHAQKGPSMPAALHRVLKWKLSPVMPKIVKRVVLNSGFRIIKNTTDWMAIWEKHMKSPGFRTIRSHQKYNHMPGSFRIGRKDSMWRSIFNNMKKYGAKEFGFMQKTYIMPDDLESLRQAWPKNASKLTKWIVKPPASARGTGIRIVNKWSQFPKDRPLVVQKYIERPLLINDNKFDMRLYVILTSINPLRIYMYKDGLARFASVKYSSELNSLDDRCMHLTNYSINKFSQNYSKNEDFNACQGHKWTLQSLWHCLENRGVNTKRLWATLRNLVVKAIISGEAGLNRMYRQNVNFRYNCFELFGFDVLLDENLIPWLLEINISPSLHSELPLDLHVKGPLIQAVLNTALYQVPPKLSEKQQREICDELKLHGPLCHDKRIFTTCLTAEEVRKHNQFTNRSIEFREDYLDLILENLLPDDIRCLIISEDEFARSKPLERVFPTAATHTYLKFIDNARYYNRLLDAWEHKYGHCRNEGIAVLSKLCNDSVHLHVSDAALEKEPNVTLTEIDMLHAKKSEDPLNVTNNNDTTNNILQQSDNTLVYADSNDAHVPVICSKDVSDQKVSA